ncbi:hypothetical protein BC332_13007 [Capsicum chinense]|nr:hypothetical protein BC332_13007 [Capsicum chinense]
MHTKLDAFVNECHHSVSILYACYCTEPMSSFGHDHLKRLQQQQAQEMQPQRVVDLEENMDISSLENRLLALIKRFPLNNHSQQFSNINSSASIGTMIPTPGMPRSSNSSLIGTSPVNNSVTARITITSSVVNSGGFLQTTNFPSASMRGVSFI